jgi:hypothetical protein
MHTHVSVTVLDVEETDRLSFMPYMFGDDFRVAEMQIYALARQHLPELGCSAWHFIRLPQGGGYMMPDTGNVLLVNSENWFDRTVSADAAGIILTMMAITKRCAHHHACCEHISGSTALTQLYMNRDAQLWHFIDVHPERAAIYAALD